MQSTPNTSPASPLLLGGTPIGNMRTAYRQARANVRNVGECLAAAGPDALTWYEDAFKAALNALAWRDEARMWRGIARGAVRPANANGRDKSHRYASRRPAGAK